jgi:hypothetical protein
VAVPQQLIVAGGNSGVNGNRAQTFTGDLIDDGNGGCPNTAVLSLDPAHLMDPAHNLNDSKFIVTVDPVSGYDLTGSVWMAQTGVFCEDYSGQYTCTGTVNSLKGGVASLQCFGGFAEFDVSGTFKLNDDLTGTFSGTWVMPGVSVGPDHVDDGTFNFDGMPVVYTGISGGGLYQSVDGASNWAQEVNGSVEVKKPPLDATALTRG